MKIILTEEQVNKIGKKIAYHGTPYGVFNKFSMKYRGRGSR